MQKIKRQTRFVNPGVALDWFVATACMVAGGYGLRLAGSTSAWNQVVERDYRRVAVGAVAPLHGRIRQKRVNSSVWQDLEGKSPTAEGDSIATGDESAALLRLADGTQVKLMANSLVIVHLEPPPKERASQKEEGFLSRFSSKPENSAEKRAYLEVKSGSVALAVKDSGKDLKVMAQNQMYEIKNAAQAGEVGFEVTQGRGVKLSAAQTAGLEVSAGGRAGKIAVERKRLPEPMAPKTKVDPVIPEVSSPVHNSRILSKSKADAEVTLRWKTLPSGLQADIDLVRIDDPGFEPRMQLNPAGAVFSAPLGQYEWRVRSINGRGGASEWTQAYRFNVVDKITQRDNASLLNTSKALAPDAADKLREDSARRLRDAERLALEQRERSEEAQRMRELTQRQQELLRKQREQALVEAKRREARRRSEEAARLLQERRLAELKRKRYEAIIAAARQRVEVMTEDPNTIKASHLASLGSVAGSALMSRGPANASTSIGKNMELDKLRLGLEWKAINGAQEYQVEVFKDGQAVEKEKVASPRYDFILRELDPAVRYSYRVSTDLPDGRHIASPTTPIQIDVSAPRPVQPRDRSQIGTGTTTIFSWAKTVLTDQYDFELALDPRFTVIVQRATQEANFIPFSLRQKGVYYWRVRGRTQKFTSDWSSAAQVTAR